MPEGDSLHRAANTLRQAIGGRVVTRFETVLPAIARIDDQAPIRGRTVESVTAVGKHLLIAFSGGLTLHSHLRMNGSWHIYRHGERWFRTKSDMRVVIETDEWIAVGFGLPVAELLDERQLERKPELRALGPDLLVDFDLADVRRRARAYASRPICEVLLNQRVAAGIGNVYKSEVCFLCRIDPWTSVAELADEQIEALFNTAATLLRHNVERQDGGRETRRGLDSRQRLWVYGREGKPCRRCGTIIEMRKTGVDARVTFFCPACQRYN